jgi:hypothetical protein
MRSGLKALFTGSGEYGYSSGWNNLPGFLKAAGIARSAAIFEVLRRGALSARQFPQ